MHLFLKAGTQTQTSHIASRRTMYVDENKDRPCAEIMRIKYRRNERVISVDASPKAEKKKGKKKKKERKKENPGVAQNIQSQEITNNQTQDIPKSSRFRSVQ